MKQVRRGSKDKKKQEIGSMGRIKKPKKAKQFRLFGVMIRIKKPKKYQEICSDDRIIRMREPKEAVALDPSVVQMELPQALLVAVEQIGGHDLVFVGKKQLTASDVNKHHDRLFVPKTTVLMEHLTRDEQKIVQWGDKLIERKMVENKDHEMEKKGKRIEAVKIVVVDAMGRLYEMEFKNWSSIGQLVIGSNWNAIVRENCLEKDDRVDLHVFRYENGRLGFAVNAAIRAQPINQVEPMDAEQNEDDWRESQVPFKFI